ncbi:MAG: hypothetical protein ACF8NJ_03930, partial [Phycisphaerales bacterium JB038]
MLRAIAAVIVGYVTLALWVMLTFSIAFLVLGKEFAFQEGSTQVTFGWILVSIVLGLIGAVIGGLVAGLIGANPRRTPVKVLAGLVLVLGLLLAVAQLFAPAEGPVEAREPDGEISTIDRKST